MDRVQQILANLDGAVLDAENGMEQAIEACAQAADVWADCVKEYRQERSVNTVALKKDNTPITIIKEVVDGMTAKLKADMLKAEAQKRKCENYVKLYEHRINNRKFIGRGSKIGA